MKCNKCNNENLSGARFCAYCGNDLSKMKSPISLNNNGTCPSCNNKIEEDEAFCGNCGFNLKQSATTAKELRCPSCNNKIEKDEAFCGNCGFNLKQSATTVKELRCPSCNNKIEKDEAFCGNCGFNLKQSATTVKELRCPSCNNKIEEDEAFCGSCGYKLTKKAGNSGVEINTNLEVEAQQKEKAKLERERIEAEKKEKARLEKERIEAERKEKAKLERERIAAQQKENERLERKRLEAELKEREKLEIKQFDNDKPLNVKVEKIKRNKKYELKYTEASKSDNLSNNEDYTPKKRNRKTIFFIIGGVFLLLILITSYYKTVVIPKREENEAWEYAESLHTESALKEFIDNYQDGTYYQDAQDELDDIMAWNTAIKENSINSIKNYIKNYPTGWKIYEARKRYKKLKESEGYEKRIGLLNNKRNELDNILTKMYYAIDMDAFDAHDYFADNVANYYGLTNTTPDKINDIYRQFIKDYTETNYEITGGVEVTIQGSNYGLSYNCILKCYRKSKRKYEYLETANTAIFNSHNKIISLVEDEVLKDKFKNRSY